MTGSFDPIDHERRVRDLRQALPEGCDAMLLTDLVDVRWLTGFTGSNGWVVLTAGDLVVGTDGRYDERARAETAAAGATVIAETNRARLHERLVESLQQARGVGLDPATTTHADWERLGAAVPLRPVPSPVLVRRTVKDHAEIQRMAAAAAAADAALAEVEPLLLAADGLTEADLRDELEYGMRRHGADDRSFDTIVASGPDHAARPHHQPTRRTIVEGDTVIIDVGALVEGYHSDMTRSYVIGEPTAQQREVYELVEQAQRAGIGSLRDGVTARAVDAACREVFVEAGYGDWYLHGTGHGVGLQIHEPPFHSPSSHEVLAAGNVVTVEPGLYRVGVGGFRIEDLLVVTETGSRPLTQTAPRPFPT
jgi:Xaa-Pro aminopeptidase